MRFVLGFITALATLALAALLMIWTGAYNVAASDPHFPPLQWALDTAMHNSVHLRAKGIDVPPRFSPEQVREGFRSFEAMCVQCHGAPGVERDEWAKGLRPQPPELSEAVTHWNSAQLFWILKHGIKMTAMPSFGETHGDEELWPVVAFVAQLPSMTPEAYAKMRQEMGSHRHEAGGHTPSR